MSDGFPLGHDETHPPELSIATFARCYHALAKLIDDESLHPGGKYAAERGVYDRQWAYDELGFWYKHASDGEIGALPTFSNGPWYDLDRMADEIGQSDADLLQSDADAIPGAWQGDNGTRVHANVLTMHRKVAQYSVANTANSADSRSYVSQVASLLSAAFAARAAFKKDLYEIAKGARDKLHEIDSLAAAASDIKMLTLAIAGVALVSAGPVIDGGKIFWKVFASTAASKAGDLTFQAATEGAHLDGGTPGEIMKAASTATNKAIDGYKSACRNICAAMDVVWNQLNDEYRTIPPGLTS